MGNCISGSSNGFKDPVSVPEGYVFRDQKGRYPWWVTSVDKITTPVDIAKWERKTTDKIQWMLGPEREEGLAKLKPAREKMLDKMRSNVPGSRLQDFALHYASETFFAAGVDVFDLTMIP